MLAVLEASGYLNKNMNIFVQCFDSEELKAINRRAGSGLPLVQLVAGTEAPDRNRLQEIAAYAAAIGPSMKLIYGGKSADGAPLLSPLVTEAHDAGLVVHPYTFRADRLPDGIRDFDELLELFVVKLAVDGLFTDFPDRVTRFLDQHT
jgi:glycerophosphoryl diester phosphodiesterase